MQTDSSARKHYWHEHIEQYQQSDLSQVGYCKKNDINYPQFIYWLRKHKQTTKCLGTQSPGFIPVSLSPAHTSLTSPLCALELNGNKRLLIFDTVALDLLLEHFG